MAGGLETKERDGNCLTESRFVTDKGLAHTQRASVTDCHASIMKPSYAQLLNVEQERATDMRMSQVDQR